MEGKRDLLEPAVEAVRRALRKMAAEEVPARLRRVAGISAKRLTAPHAERVLAELDASEWLREKALERWDEVPESIGGSRPAAEAYLRRSDGWESTLEAGVREVQLRAAIARVDALETELKASRASLERLQEKLKRERSEAKAQLLEMRRQADERSAARGNDSEALRRALRRTESALEVALEEMARVSADLAEADGRIAFLLERGARRDPATERASTQAVFGRGAPQASARTLDHLAEALESLAPRPAPHSPPATVFPRELRPDRPEAIDWLLSRSEPVTILVDGYNVAHAIGAGGEAIGRARVAAAAARLRRRANSPLTVKLFWDSDQGVDTAREGGVIVAFVESADDAIVEAARAAGGVVAVITSDREVRERSQATVAVWSEAFAAWL